MEVMNGGQQTESLVTFLFRSVPEVPFESSFSLECLLAHRNSLLEALFYYIGDRQCVEEIADNWVEIGLRLGDAVNQWFGKLPFVLKKIASCKLDLKLLELCVF